MAERRLVEEKEEKDKEADTRAERSNRAKLAERVLRNRRMSSSERLAKFNAIERKVKSERAELRQLKSEMERNADRKLIKARRSKSRSERRSASRRVAEIAKVIGSESLARRAERVRRI